MNPEIKNGGHKKIYSISEFLSNYQRDINANSPKRCKTEYEMKNIQNNNNNNNNNIQKMNLFGINDNNIQKMNSFGINDNNLLNNVLNINIEHIDLYTDDNNFKSGEFIVKNYECKFIFDHRVLLEMINEIHFTPKYFEFPIFYFFKGTYDKDSKIIKITLKDYRSYKIKACSNNILNILNNSFNNEQDLMLYAKNYKILRYKEKIVYPKNGWELYDPYCEYLRQGINDQFNFSEINLNYNVCETYPSVLVVPKEFNYNGIYIIASSRMKNRFPVLSYYYHAITDKSLPKEKGEIKSYLYRSSQIISKSQIFEIEYMNKIMNIENNGKGFIIFDCRPYLNAKANSFKGAGVEDIKQYKNCQELIFGNIENIHCVRKSLKAALLKAYYGNETIVKGKISFNINNLNMKNFLTKFEDTKWLKYISDLLLGSITVVNHLLKGVNVLVHCSDGWDRTSQICSLVQIILDPFFRTIEGFAVLIEKEWVSFGHPFAIRNGCSFQKDSKKERSPIFIQFIHAVHQMTLQYPTAFEFNSNLLLFLCREIYSNKYGTFLFNCERDLVKNGGMENTISIWSDVFLEKNKYINDIYKEMKEPINVKGELQYLNVWNDYFFQFDKLGRVKENGIYFDKGQNLSNVIKDNKKSILELLKIIKEEGKEDKMKNNKFYNLYKNEL